MQLIWKRLSRNKVPNNHFLKSVQNQPYADVLQSTCSSKFRNSKAPMLEVIKRLQHRCFPGNISKFVRTAFFFVNLRWLLLSVWESNCRAFEICRPSLINQKHNLGWFLLRRFVDLSRVCSLHTISRNQNNTFLLINMQKTKTCSK